MPNMNLKKLWRRKSVDITEYDPTYKVIYLGNVLTGWAKGEGCVEKPLATLWRNYCQSSRPDISMKVTICGAGLQAVTEEHGLTEYWAHRITYCTAHRAYPRVFCWVYRHEGRRLKQELRCHAVLCPKQTKAEAMSSQLKERLALALHDFRREKAIRQNARLSIVNAVYSIGSLPRRKRYLVIGASNYRPPLERSKSAPKLGAIEEIVEEEEEEEIAKEGERKEVGEKVNRKTPLAMSTSSHLDALLSSLRNSNYSPTISSSADVSPSEVAYVYQQVEDTPEGVTLPSECVTFSTPNLLFYHGHSPERTPSSPKDRGETTLPIPSPLLPTMEVPHKSPAPSPSPSPDDLGLLESIKDKLGLSNGEESLTSDQTESIGSHSCSSSCGSGDETILILEVGGKRILGEERKESGKGVVEEDNISEESGYSEDKECFPLRV